MYGVYICVINRHDIKYGDNIPSVVNTKKMDVFIEKGKIIQQEFQFLKALKIKYSSRQMYRKNWQV